MKRFAFLLGLAAIGLIAYHGCAGSKPVSEIPEWYVNPPSDPNFIFAAGTATSSDMQLAKDKASDAARMEVAKSIETKFDGLSKRFQEEIAVSGDTELLDYFVQATKAVVSIVLTGVTTDKAEILKESGGFRVYILMKMDVASSNTALMDRLKQQDEMWTRFRASQTFQELEEETSKFDEYKRQQ